MTTKKLTFRQKILVAGTLFGMFFGAGNLIFPVHLGQMAGRNAVVAMIGFIITAVGIPIFGVAAIGITHSDGLQTLSSKVGKGYGIFFTCLLYLTIGPLFAIPRCETVSFTTGITPLLGADSPEWLYLLVFSAAFFAFVLFFSLRPGKITLWIGKIINPIFLLFLAVLRKNRKAGRKNLTRTDGNAASAVDAGRWCQRRYFILRKAGQCRCCLSNRNIHCKQCFSHHRASADNLGCLMFQTACLL